MIFEVCKNRPKIIKVCHSGCGGGVTGRGGAGLLGEGLKTLRVMQKSAEDCKELGIGKLL